jgi:hypothetical protein
MISASRTSTARAQPCWQRVAEIIPEGAATASHNPPHEEMRTMEAADQMIRRSGVAPPR